MKRSKRERILWIIISTIMIAGMIIFTIMPFLTAAN